jgi:hypothetical protein
MALAKGTNSYATVEEADAYFADRIDVAAWASASAEDKAKALVTATQMLDGMNWSGTAVSEGQSLAFPRSTTYFEPRLGQWIILDGTTVPLRIIQSMYELAYHLVNNDGVLDESGGVKSLQVGAVRLENVQAAPRIPYGVRAKVAPLLVSGGASGWWRAN